jgi:DNA helicase-2/ATP-dependent DNA helicase PcrA
MHESRATAKASTTTPSVCRWTSRREPPDHDGLFAVAPKDAHAYAAAHGALCLRHSAAVAKDVDLPFINIGIAKGMDVERVLIWPTASVVSFLREGKALKTTPCSSLYVAVTRARASVAFIVEDPSGLSLPVWSPA